MAIGNGKVNTDGGIEDSGDRLNDIDSIVQKLPETEADDIVGWASTTLRKVAKTKPVEAELANQHKRKPLNIPRSVNNDVPQRMKVERKGKSGKKAPAPVDLPIKAVIDAARYVAQQEFEAEHGHAELASILTVENRDRKNPYARDCIRIQKNIHDMIAGTLEFSDGKEVDASKILLHAQKQALRDMQWYFISRKEALGHFKDKHSQLLTREFTKLYMEELVHADVPSAILTLDLKGLGVFNTAIGAGLTNKLLLNLFTTMRGMFRGDDQLVARRQQGGDEMDIILPGVENLKELNVILQRCIGKLAHPLELKIDAKDAASIRAIYKSLSPTKEKEREAYTMLNDIIIPQLDRATVGGGCILEINLAMRFAGKLLKPEEINKDRFDPQKELEDAELDIDFYAKPIEQEGIAPAEGEPKVVLEFPAVVTDGDELYYTGKGRSEFVKLDKDAFERGRTKPNGSGSEGNDATGEQTQEVSK